MPSGRSIRAGEAFVEIFGDDSRLRRTMRRLGRDLRAFGSTARSIGAATFAAVSAPTAAIAAVSIKAASDANEIRNRFRAVFRDQADQAGRFADELGDAVGRSGTKLRAVLSDYMGFFAGLGFGRERARELSEQLTALGLDFASFNNLADEEAAARFISAISGSSEVVARFGINLKVAALDAELLRMGVQGGAASASELDKALARVNIIAKSLGTQGAIGDASRTAAQFANQTRRLADETFDLRDAIGSALLPTATQFIGVANGLIDAAGEFADTNAELIKRLAGTATATAAVAAGVVALGVAATVAASPLFIAAGAAAALTAALVYTGSGRTLLDALGGAGIAERFADDLERIIELLQGGDLAAAAEVAAARFEVTWLEAIDRVRTALDGVVGDLTGIENPIAKAQNAAAQGLAFIVDQVREGGDAAHEIGLAAGRAWAEFFNADDLVDRIDELELARREGEVSRDRYARNAGELITSLLDRAREANAAASDTELEAARDRLAAAEAAAAQAIADRDAARDQADDQAGQAAEAARARTPLPAVGSLSGRSALQQLLASGDGRLVQTTQAILAEAKKIRTNTAAAAVFT